MSQTPAEPVLAAAPVHNNFFARLYYGELSLPVTFWVFGVLLATLFNICLTALLYILFLDPDASDFIAPLGGLGSMLVILAISLSALAYTFVVLVGQWRAATQYKGRKLWAILVKICVVLGAINTVLMLPDLLQIVLIFYPI